MYLERKRRIMNNHIDIIFQHTKLEITKGNDEAIFLSENVREYLISLTQNILITTMNSISNLNHQF